MASSKEQNVSRRKRRAENEQKLLLGEISKRINPMTGEFFKRGDRDGQERYFVRYRNDVIVVGDYLPEEWVDFKTWETIKK
ncbi:hypothetical protein N8248_09915 [Rhodospirillaceae bacterium]|nr:hypothetical protein [Rhodospirillaceae bacterium]